MLKLHFASSIPNLGKAAKDQMYTELFRSDMAKANNKEKEKITKESKIQVLHLKHFSLWVFL